MSGRTSPCVSATRPMTRLLTLRLHVACSRAPPSRQIVLYTNLVEDSSDNERHQVVDFGRAMVEARGCRKHDGTRSRHLEHVSQMDLAEGCFPRHEHKLASFLEGD